MKMRNPSNGIEINVVHHVILRNFWEYYLTDDPTFALVVGLETELGYIDLDEIRPYIMSVTSDFEDILPAPGWKWVKNEVSTCPVTS